jgi:hypothetical protein
MNDEKYLLNLVEDEDEDEEDREYRTNTINKILEKEILKDVKYFTNSDHDKKFLRALYEETGEKRYTECNTYIVLDYIKFLIEKYKTKKYIYMGEFKFSGKEDWANMTIGEIRDELYDIPNVVKNEIVNIIEWKIKEKFIFDW